MARPIALLTDFGLDDAYVGVMKGVLLSRAPECLIIDLSHGVPPQDIVAGALHLASAVPYFPEETVFIAVVDPGVGGERRPLCLRSGGRLLVGPDNGLLWPAATACGVPEAFRLDRPEYWLPRRSATFHGRDIFAPVAAALATGRQPDQVGSPLGDPIRLEIPRPTVRGEEVRGEVLLIDRFGNAIASLRPDDLGQPGRGEAVFEVAGHRLTGPSTHYAAAGPGEPVVVVGSLGYLEIAVNGGSAARTIGIQRGDPVRAWNPAYSRSEGSPPSPGRLGPRPD